MRIFFFSSLLLGLAAAGCSAHADDTSADPQPQQDQDPPVLAGEYTATNGGDVASIGFYGSEYTLRPPSCGVGDAACAVHGTYRVNEGTLALRPDGSATETIWPFHVKSTEGGAPPSATATQSLQPLVALIEKTSCLLANLADSFTANGITYSRGNVTDDFQKNVVGAAGSPYAGKEGFPQDNTFQPLLSAASASCGSSSQYGQLSLINWAGMKIADIKSCGAGGQSDAYYTPYGTRIATYDGTNTNYDNSPLVALMQDQGKCQ
jgi:hypothetical protein